MSLEKDYDNWVKSLMGGGKYAATPEQAAADSGRSVRLVENLLQSRDHPAAINAGQSLYLKGHILQVL